MLLGIALRPPRKGIQDGAKQLLTWAFTGNRNISSTSFVGERFKNQSDEYFEKNNRDYVFEKAEDLEYEEEFNRRPRRYDRFDRHVRYEREGRGDDHFGSSRRDRFDSYNRYDKYNRYDRRSVNKFYTNISQMKDIDWNSEKLSPFKKDFYNPHSSSLNRPIEEIKRFYQSHDITVRGENCPPPVFSFDELGLPEEVLTTLRKLNYTEPTPIQSLGCPIALSGRNMVGVSRTGSGKTLAFILPAVIHIHNQPPLERCDGPIALVVAPTRELVQQIKGVSDAFRQCYNLKTAVAYGGTGRSSQAVDLSRGAHICIATPGRLLDFLNSGTINLKRCTYLVLDEADRMFDMGFEPQVREIIEHVRPDRQVLMWSATWPKEIRNLAAEHLRDYIQINVGSAELTANPNIRQIVHVCQERDKNRLLLEILNETKNEAERKTLIFTRTKTKADEVAFWLRSKGFKADAMHGDKSQTSRDNTLRLFRSGKVLYLVATSVAARGLDVQDIRYVINYDYPEVIEDYVHRIGRTARHESLGTAHTFFTNADASKADELIEILRKSNQEINPELLEINNYNGKFYTKKRRNSWH